LTPASERFIARFRPLVRRVHLGLFSMSISTAAFGQELAAPLSSLNADAPLEVKGRAEENVVRQSADAFGATIGSETVIPTVGALFLESKHRQGMTLVGEIAVETALIRACDLSVST
jgi:hypothetical protein